MAVATGFQNQEAAKTAAIELVNMTTPNSPGYPRYYDTPLTGHARWPYQKTRSGAINTCYSPYERYRHFWQMTGAGSLFLVLALVSRRPF